MSEQVMNKKKAVEILQDFNDYRRNVGIYDVDEPCEPKNSATDIVTHVGIKLGHLTLGIALKDLGEHELPRNKNGNFIINTWDALDDYDGKGNTERLKKAGLDFELGAGQWIPSLGELRFILMHVKQLNQALAALGADPFVKDWYWSSTEYGVNNAWGVNFSNGLVYTNSRTFTYRVRAVAAF